MSVNLATDSDLDSDSVTRYYSYPEKHCSLSICACADDLRNIRIIKQMLELLQINNLYKTRQFENLLNRKYSFQNMYNFINVS